MSSGGCPASLICVLLSLLAPAGGLLLIGGPVPNRPPGKPLVKIEQRRGFYVAGLARRTDNAKEASGTGEIARVWQEFTDKHVADRIPGKLGRDLIAVYTDYESNQDGEYTYLLGTRVAELQELPAGLIGRYIPSGRYAEFTSEKGPITEVVPKMWQRVWAMSPLALKGRRAFEADYELYDERARDPKNAQVDLFIGLE